MSNEENLDELIDRIQELSEEERRDLVDSVREDQLTSYLDIRGRYIERLREEELLGRFPEDSPWSEYCETHPYDPICQRIMPHEEMRSHRRKFDRIHDEFVDELREADLPYFDESPERPSIFPSRWLCWRYPWLCPFDASDWYCRQFPWSWRCFCRRYPWLCSDLEVPELPVPDPGPYGSRVGDMAARSGAMGMMPSSGFGGAGAPSSWPPSGAYSRGTVPPRLSMMQSYRRPGLGDGGGLFETGGLLNRYLCRLAPEFCSPLEVECTHFPWLPWCRDLIWW